MTQFFWDTNIFIYLWEGPVRLTPLVEQLRRKMLDAQIGIVTSSMTLGELMVGPLKTDNAPLAQRYDAALKQTTTIVPFGADTAARFASLRAQYGLKQPDAIQLACASMHGVELFITNDDKLWKLRIPGIHFIVSIETALSLIP